MVRPSAARFRNRACGSRMAAYSLMLQVIDTRVVVAARIGRRESSLDKLLEEVTHLLPSDDPCARAVLVAQAHTGMQHHVNEKTRLSFRKPETGH
jgi:hypothetical protein